MSYTPTPGLLPAISDTNITQVDEREFKIRCNLLHS